MTLRYARYGELEAAGPATPAADLLAEIRACADRLRQLPLPLGLEHHPDVCLTCAAWWARVEPRA